MEIEIEIQKLTFIYEMGFCGFLEQLNEKAIDDRFDLWVAESNSELRNR